MNDIDDEYRRAAAQDPGQPSEATRRNILDHAAKLAAQRATGDGPVIADFQRPAANQPVWRRAMIGTLAAAGLAGLLITPLFLSRSPSPSAGSSPTAARNPLPAPAAGSLRTYSFDLSARVASPEPVVTLSPPAPPPATVRNVTAQGAPLADKAVTADAARQDTAARPQFAAAPAPAAAREAGASVRAEPMAGASRLAGSAARATDTATSLQQAARTGDLARLQALLETPVDIDARDAHGRTALMLATLQGQAGAVETLIAHGADVNIVDADGITPLQAARAGAQPGIAAALQRAGAR